MLATSFNPPTSPSPFTLKSRELLFLRFASQRSLRCWSEKSEKKFSCFPFNCKCAECCMSWWEKRQNQGIYELKEKRAIASHAWAGCLLVLFVRGHSRSQKCSRGRATWLIAQRNKQTKIFDGEICSFKCETKAQSGWSFVEWENPKISF